MKIKATAAFFRELRFTDLTRGLMFDWLIDPFFALLKSIPALFTEDGVPQLLACSSNARTRLTDADSFHDHHATVSFSDLAVAKKAVEANCSQSLKCGTYCAR